MLLPRKPDPATEAPALAEAIAPTEPKLPTVAKAFNTENRRFAVGDPITRDDLKGSARDFDRLVEGGFISK